ncbi:MAG: hypothetical protein RLZZ385_103 [Pseudomonadota bacterium]|jgi:multicomponent Na+:H+ antiporter subunit G
MSLTDVTLLDLLTMLLLAGGGFFVFVGGIGAIRMPDLFTRMHAASLTDTMGSVLILVALMLQAGFSLITLKLLAILIFLVFTSPVSSYALANAATLAGLLPKGTGLDHKASVQSGEETP